MSDCAGTNRILTLVKHCHWSSVISRQSVTVLGSSSQPTSTATWLVAKFRRECQKWANICSNSRSARFHFLPPFPGRLLSAACRDCNSGFIHWKPMKKRVRAKNYHRGFWQEYRVRGYYFWKENKNDNRPKYHWLIVLRNTRFNKDIYWYNILTK